MDNTSVHFLCTAPGLGKPGICPSPGFALLIPPYLYWAIFCPLVPSPPHASQPSQPSSPQKVALGAAAFISIQCCQSQASNPWWGGAAGGMGV